MLKSGMVKCRKVIKSAFSVRRSEVRCQRSKIRDRKAEGGGRRLENRGQRAEVRGQESRHFICLHKIWTPVFTGVTTFYETVYFGDDIEI